MRRVSRSSASLIANRPVQMHLFRCHLPPLTNPTLKPASVVCSLCPPPPRSDGCTSHRKTRHNKQYSMKSTGNGTVDVIQPPAPPLTPRSTINLHMPASDLTCFDPPSPSQATPASPAMSARSHHALSPPRTTRCRPIRASPDITRPLIHRPCRS